MTNRFDGPCSAKELSYIYDGLYRVATAGKDVGADGYVVCK